ncbi:MAG: M6 family metalloprotease domain-containing protein [Candidatus Hydrogenedentes bacterium]|nr:M6 family metalloprotease domain-containing protein [Candidatus Hydrogenedentota bacterium]
MQYSVRPTLLISNPQSATLAHAVRIYSIKQALGRIRVTRFALCATLVSILLLFAFAAPESYAAPAAPIDITLKQPDGSNFKAQLRGDEFSNWYETEEGYTILEQTGTWYYAEKSATGQLTASPNEVGTLSEKTLSSMPRHLRPPVDPRAFEKTVPRTLGAGATKSLVHTQPVLTILVNYTNISFAYTDANFQSAIYGASNSVKEFYLENTYGTFTVTTANETYGTANDGIVHITRPVVHPNMGGGDSRPEASAILSAANSYVNYATFDSNSDGTITSDELAIVMILAGYENAYGGTYTPKVWGHAWTLSSALMLDGVNLQPYTMFGERHRSDADDNHMATIGIMCHELGHLMLELPDLYDTDESSEGIGNWGLMGGGSWNYIGTWAGDSPAHLSAWCKSALDIVTPTDVLSSTTGANILEGSSNASILRLWVDKYRIGEYFLIENRQQSGFDAGLPGNGLLIWHVDDRMTDNTDESHKWVDLEEADGLNGLDLLTNRGDAGDTYPGIMNNTTFNNTSNPNSKDYTNTATGIAVTSISSSGASMTANIVPSATGGMGDHVRYDENGATGYAFGYSSSTAWTALQVTNDTTMNSLDGFEVYINDSSATVDFYLYSTISGGVPTTLLYSQTGFSATAGWNRFLLSTPQSFPASSDRVMVLKIVNASFGFPAGVEYAGNYSGRSYIDFDGAGAFSALPEDLNQVVLLSSPYPAVNSVVRVGTSPTNAASVDFTVTFNKAVTGVDATDLSLSASGVTGASITSVSADAGATRTVSVSTGTGSGTIRLDVVDNDSIVDGNGEKLGGVGSGNGSFSSGEVYTIDKSAPNAPSVTGTTPTNDTTPTWSWSSGGNGGNGTYRYQLDSQSGAWTTTTSLSYTPATALSAAAHTLYVQERDAAGNWSASGSYTITIDTTAPNAPSVTGTTPTNDTTPTWSWSSGGGGGNGTYRYQLNSQAGAWTTTTSLSYTPATPLSDATYTLYVQERDAVGNWSASGSFAIALDATPPNAPNVSGTSPTNDTTPTWSWTSGGGGGNGTYRYQLNSQAGAWTTTTSLSYTPVTALSEGAQTLYVQERDNAGNWSASDSKSITIDATPPTVSISAPSSTVTATGPVTFSVTYTEASVVTLDNGDVSLNATGDANATITLSGLGSSARTITLSSITGNGTLGISLAADTAFDYAGNKAPAAGPSATFTVDNTAIAVNIGAPSSMLTKSGPVSYTITYDNAASISLDETDVSLVTTGTATGTVNVSGAKAKDAQTRTVTISGITGDGTLAIGIASGTALDSSSNSAPAAGPSGTFTVDNTKPVITLVGSNPVYVTEGNAYFEAGATASDNIDGDISGSVVDDSNLVDTNSLGTYTVTYNVTDAAGNAADSVTRTVIVEAESSAVPIAAWPVALVLLAVGTVIVRRARKQ